MPARTASATKRRSFRMARSIRAAADALSWSPNRNPLFTEVTPCLISCDNRAAPGRPTGGSAAEPRALVARSERTCSRPRCGSERAVARAHQVLLDLLVQPRRVLHGACCGPTRPGRFGALGAVGGRSHPAPGAGRDP